jgi:hypothetical protein
LIAWVCCPSCEARSRWRAPSVATAASRITGLPSPRPRSRACGDDPDDQAPMKTMIGSR